MGDPTKKSDYISDTYKDAFKVPHQTGKTGAARLMPGGVLFLVACVLGVFAATQTLAAAMHYNPDLLGVPWEQVGGLKIYRPWSFFVWTWQYHVEIPTLLKQTVWPMFAGLVVGVAAWIWSYLSLAPESEGSDFLDSARFANTKDIEKMGLLFDPYDAFIKLRDQGKDPQEACSVVLGRHWDGRIMYDNSKTHIMLNGPTGSWKGVSIIIPTLVTWMGSVIVTDIKGENWRLTAEFRKRFSHVLFFRPGDPNSVRFNPLLEIRRGIHAIDDVMTMTEILCEKERSDPFWDGGGGELLRAVILHTLYAEKRKSMGRVVELMSEIKDTFDLMQRTAYEDEHADKFIKMVVGEYLKMKDVEKILGGRALTASAFIMLWKSPTMQMVTETSDFRLSDLQFYRKPISLYIVVPPGKELTRLATFLRLFFSMTLDRLGRDEGEPGRKHRLLMLLDEFPRYGKMPDLQDLPTWSRGYGIKCMFITQSFLKIDELYGKNQDLVASCDIRILLGAQGNRDAEEFSKMMGNFTAVEDQVSVTKPSGGWLGSSGQKASSSHSKRSSVRALLTAGELQGAAFPKNRALIKIAGEHVIYTRKLAWFLEPHFKQRVPMTQAQEHPYPSEPGYDVPKGRVEHDWYDIAKPDVAPSEEELEDAMTSTPSGAQETEATPQEEKEKKDAEEEEDAEEATEMASPRSFPPRATEEEEEEPDLLMGVVSTTPQDNSPPDTLEATPVRMLPKLVGLGQYGHLYRELTSHEAPRLLHHYDTLSNEPHLEDAERELLDKTCRRLDYLAKKHLEETMTDFNALMTRLEGMTPEELFHEPHPLGLTAQQRVEVFELVARKFEEAELGNVPGTLGHVLSDTEISESARREALNHAFAREQRRRETEQPQPAEVSFASAEEVETEKTLALHPSQILGLQMAEEHKEHERKEKAQKVHSDEEKTTAIDPKKFQAHDRATRAYNAIEREDR